MKRMTSYRLAVASRIFAAAIGGYAVASLFAAASSQLLMRLGVARSEAVLAPTMASFLVYAVIVLCVFHARSAGRAWVLIVLAACPGLLTLWLLWPEAIG